MDFLISVIVPIFNTAALLPRCVDSLLAQTCGDIEIVLVDDGSTDGSGALCSKYAQEYVNIFAIHQENNGVSAARNAGLSAARGRYLGFVDSDDWIKPEMYDMLLSAMKEYDTQIAACGYAIHRYDGVVYNNMVNQSTPSLLKREQALESLIHPSGIQGFLCNKLFDRALLIRVGGGELLRLDEKIHICEDLLFVSRCIETVEYIAYTGLPLYIYCVRDYGGPENYNREKRMSELLALDGLVDSWCELSQRLGDQIKQKYTTDVYHIMRAAAGAGDCANIPVLRGHLKRYLRSYLRSKAVPAERKARVLLSFALPNLENRIKKIIRKRRSKHQ